MLETGQERDLPELVWTAFLLTLLLGVVGAVLLAVLSPWLVRHVLNVSPGLQRETLRSFQLLALSLPWVISTAGFRGALEAGQRFGLVNALRVPMGLFSYVAPLAVLPFSSSLVPVVAVLVAGRLLGWAAHLLACLRVFPALRGRWVVDWSRAGMLARFGGWMTVSNVVSPLMTHLDRFLIGALISMTAVAYYATPYELVTKLWIVPSALIGVFFPAFAATFASDRARTAVLFDRAVRAIFLAVFPVTLVVIALAHEGMMLWLGEDFAANSTVVLRWLAAGVFVNCLAQAPFALVQGVGRPDLTGKLHLLELPLYAGAILLLSHFLGLQGIAIAWVLRVAVDTAILFAVAHRFLPRAAMPRRALGMTVGAGLAFGVATIDAGLAVKLTLLGAAGVLFAPFAWWFLLAPAERSFVRARLAARRDVLRVPAPPPAER
jgi:O-antigen/teichoic acid export membrane protein